MVSLPFRRRPATSPCQGRFKFQENVSLTPIPEDVSCRDWYLLEGGGSSTELSTAAPPFTPPPRRRQQRRQRQRQKAQSATTIATTTTTTTTTTMYSLINQERKRHNLPLLKQSQQLERLARIHALSMSNKRAVVHSVQNIQQLRYLLQSQMVGENVQRGGNKSLEQMHNVAMKEHEVNRCNILGRTFTECGIAVVQSNNKDDGEWYVCQYFRG